MVGPGPEGYLAQQAEPPTPRRSTGPVQSWGTSTWLMYVKRHRCIGGSPR